ncbi:hypothetical protein O6H91_Y494400 [Diphasiastrum complanatum]|nr:hypothetical protein O6H91_Y494400 [Diphasiastrum complanatum]
MGVDSAFVLDPEWRPKLGNTSNSSDQIPVIDLEPIWIHHPTRIQQVVEQIGEACENWGFFQIINHGIPLLLFDELKELAVEFFRLPVSEKRLVGRSLLNPLGFSDIELTKNVRDWKEIFDFVIRGVLEVPAEFEGNSEAVHQFQNKWPLNPSGLRDACEKWAAAVRILALKLLELISCSLGLSPTHFHDFFVGDTSYMRLNYYSKCEAPDLVLGVGRHKDSGGLTVLMQDEVEGLEVKRKDGEWIRISPCAGAFVVNLGGLFQVWSNDKFLSVEHRVVVNKHKDRFSIPLFLNPNHNTSVAPIEELLDAEHPPMYHPINWGKFYRRRKAGNFQNLGVENLQISHYLISQSTFVTSDYT